MRLLLLLAFLPVFTIACTTGYNLVFDGQCLTRITNKNGQRFDAAKNICDSDDSHLPIIPSQKDNEQYHAVFVNAGWLGLTCDGEKFIWDDGTVATFTNFQGTETCNSTNVNRRYFINGSDGKWGYATDGNSNSFDPICQANTRSWICDTYHLLEEGKSDDTCFLLDSKPTSLPQAETNCENKQAHVSPIKDQWFNDYLKRTAVSNGWTNGVHIGLKHVNDVYVWSDGSAASYTNFAPGFPDPSFGECVAMGINLFPGKWMNVDCNALLPYMCTKPTLTYDETVAPAGCGDDDLEFYPGDEIFSPTWGSATGPALCDYALMDLDKSKNVTVEIVFFESNVYDTLTIYDGLFGSKVLTTLSGYYGPTSTKLTATSNAIRMEWNAQTGAHVRGWHAKVGSV